MSSGILQFVRPAIRNLKAYSSARSLNTKGEIYLDANESPWGQFRRYPEPQPKKLKLALANLYEREPEEIFIGRGTDEAIDTLVRTFCEAREDAILICPPTYGVYEVAASIQGASVQYVNQHAENDFTISAEKIIASVEPNTKLVFICSPNNPTGNLLEEKTFDAIATALVNRAILVIDEAYVEFSDSPSFCHRLSQFPNLVVLRTLSKAWALAGIRCGTAIANPELVEMLQKVRAPYPISTSSLEVALSCLSDEGRDQMKARVRRVIEQRESMRLNLEKIEIVEDVFPSSANFLLVKVKDSNKVMRACGQNGIVLRDRSQDVELSNCVRISVGTESENALVLKVLSELSNDK